MSQKEGTAGAFANVEDTDFADIDDLRDGARAGNAAPDETVKTGDELEAYIEDIADTVRIGLDQSIAILTPWFFNNMPSIYYQTTPRQEKVRHLSAIITGHVFETKQTVELWDRDRGKVTYIGPGSERIILTEMAKKLSLTPFKMGALYFSRDRLLMLSTFFCNAFIPAEKDNARITEKLNYTRQSILKEFPDEVKQVDAYLNDLDNDYITYATARRMHITYRMLRYMHSHEGAHTFVEPFVDSNAARITIGMKNTEPAQILETMFYLVERYQFKLRRAFSVKFTEGVRESIAVIHLILENVDGTSIQPEAISVRKLSKAFRTLGWVDVDEYDVFSREPYELSVNACNLVRSMAHWVHIALSKQSPYVYSMYKIRHVLTTHSAVTLGLVDLFRMKFDPLMSAQRTKNGYAGAYEKTKNDIAKIVEEVDRHIMSECLNFIHHILKTNYFLRTKTGLAFRLDPSILNGEFYTQKPFGIFFLVGKDFRMFHVRWKDVARGGLRVVMPRSSADYDHALVGLFDEVYGLSYAQQLKNKDIPEGGSKAVLLLKPGGHRDQAVRGAVNALLDLLVSEDESHEGKTSELVSYYTKEEIIYLGPDENITNDLINWITEQAKRRGYTYHAAFMSSKPGAGINHKQYGVTSEGLNVFVSNMLQYLGIDPKKERFSVKISGGPDGDVAGNELNILHREFGENARVVAISDGYGCAYDPDGLKWTELLRLFKEGKAIDQFDAKLLSSKKEAFVLKADNNENMIIRNELPARKYADIFIPAGGRPYTVNDKNWSLYLDDNGKPTVRAIVEGANIYFTAGAREQLQKHGVLTIKDSSANKTGVICSSYEIIACHVLSVEEFSALKETYVSQVIGILRKKADLEAKLLFREFSAQDGARTLVELSLTISQEINNLTDALLEEFVEDEEKVLKDPVFQALVYKHCPPVLVERYRDRILERLPKAHQIAIVSAYIASNVVYREGLGWLHGIPEGKRYEAARTYMTKNEYADSLVREVMNSTLKDKEQIAEILRRSAARDLTMVEIEKD